MAAAIRLHRRASLVLLILTMLVGTRTTWGQQAADKAMEAVVRELLMRYSGALESLDADAVKKVQPSIDTDNLRRAFQEMRTLTVEIDTVKVLSTSGDTARVSCRVRQTLTPKAGTKQTTAVQRVMRLRKLEAGWVIDSFER